LARPGERRLCR